MCRDERERALIGEADVLAHTLVSHGVQGQRPAGARGVLAHTFFLSLCAAAGGRTTKTNTVVLEIKCGSALEGSRYQEAETI